MKKDRSVVFFDIDGTIFEAGKGTPDSTREAMKRLKENGHIPILCTGRPKCSLLPEILDMGFPGFIGGAGSYIEYEGKVLRNITVEHSLQERTVECMEAADCVVVLEGPDYLSYRWDGTAGDYYEILGRFHRESPHLVKEMEPDKDETNKISAHLNNMEAFQALVPRLQKDFTVVQYERYPFVEMMPAGINKADGIEALLSGLKIQRSHTYAFGDGPNDLEMLQYVQYGTAMGNSESSLMQMAQYKTEGMWEDGIYLGLKRYGLI